MNDITIVFVNYKTKEVVLKAIDSVRIDISGCPYKVQVVVVDNSQNYDSIKEVIAESYKEVLFVDAGENIGFGAANTLGFKHSPARYYFALNPDTIIPHDSKTVKKIVEFLDENPKIGCIGPKLINIDGTAQKACYRFDFWSIASKPFKQINLDKKFVQAKKFADRLLMADFAHNETRPVDWVLGAAMVVRREVVEDIGWFDKRYFMYLEDCDWCKTMWEHGWPVYYVHNIVIHHQYARESARIPGSINALLKNKLARAHLKSWMQYLWKWRGKHKYYGPLS